jgi:hypothetical protein
MHGPRLGSALNGQSGVLGRDNDNNNRIPIFESVTVVTAGSDDSVHQNHWPDRAIPMQLGEEYIKRQPVCDVLPR